MTQQQTSLGARIFTLMDLSITKWSIPELRFEVVVEPSPKQFKGMRWVSYIKKLSDTKIAMGLEWAKREGEFERFGETIAVKEP